MTLPIIDLATADVNNLDSMSYIAKNIALASKSTGFFYAVNHGIPDALSSLVLDQTARLFALPQPEKQLLDITKSKYMRGYFGHGADKSDGLHDDIKEGFDLALDLPITDPYVSAGLPFYGPNTWPATLPEFRPAISTYYEGMMRLGQTLLHAFAIGLNVAPDFFTSRFTKPMAQLRLLRYPAHHGLQQQKIGAGAHTDFGYLTIILQDQAGGLEIQQPNSTWLPVPPLPGSLVVNIGDLMQRWTNDHYTATIHRVVNNPEKPRYSAAFFMDPDYHARIECLPTCINAARPARHAPVTAGEYMQQRFAETTKFRPEAA